MWTSITLQLDPHAVKKSPMMEYETVAALPLLHQEEDYVTVEEIEKKFNYPALEPRRMVKNVVFISISFSIMMTAIASMANLQSSINNGPEKAGLGNWSLAVIHAVTIISALFVPTYVINRLTVKWTIFIAMIAHTSYIVAQFNPQFRTLIPAAAVVGFSSAPLWVARSTYLTHIGREYAAVTGEKNSEIVIMRFIGIFYFVLQSYNIVGNLISSTVLSLGVDESKRIMNPPSSCGANFCPGTNLTSFENPNSKDKSEIWTLAGIYLIIGLAAPTFLGIFVDPLTRYGENDKDCMSAKLTGRNLLAATLKQMIKPYQLLIIPLTIWSGLEAGFIGADFTAAYITCGWGVENVGYVLISYGVGISLSSFYLGELVGRFGRVFVFSLSAALNMFLMVCLLHWEPNPEEKHLFFILAALWGFSESVWHCGLNAYYGVLFAADEEASYSSAGVWGSVGLLISFAESNLMCVNSKLYILSVVLCVGMLGFYTVEFCERRKSFKKGT